MTEILPPSMLNKEVKLRRIIRDCKSVVVAYSGGVDSTLIAKIASQELGEKSLMVIADSPSLARQELHEALELGDAHNFKIRIITTDEIDNPFYRANNSNRCYYCKKTLYLYLEAIREEMGFLFIANGDHLEDQNAHRPGKLAAQEKGIRSFLAEAEFTKQEVRGLAQKLGLPNHNKPSSPCLSSRILTGTEVTPQKLQQIEKAEAFLKNHYGVSELRVRHWGSRAEIETREEFFPIIRKHVDRIGGFFSLLGFKEWSLNPHPLRSGSFSRLNFIKKEQ